MGESGYGDVIAGLGDYGPYQKKIFFIFCLPAAMKAAIVMSSVFTMSLPRYRCAVPDYPNDTYSLQCDYHQQVINITIPTTIRNNEESYAHCSIYDTNSTEMANNSSPKVQTNCDYWVYDSAEFSTSITTEYDLVCSRRAIRSHVNMGFFAGSLIGSFLFGFLADLSGRKISLLLCIGLQSVCGVSLYFVTSLYAVIVIRSVQGMTCMMFAISASTGMELVGPDKRTFAGVVVEFFWSGGVYLVALVCFLTDHWRLSQLVFGVASLLLLPAVCYVPESPRWLMDKGKVDRAEKIFMDIAHSNKKSWSKDRLTRVTDQRLHSKTNSDFSITHLLKNKHGNILLSSLIVFLNWFAVNFLYYGLSFNLDNLSGSLYVNYTLSATVELFAFFVCFVILKFLGRKTCYVSTMLLGGVACLLVIFPTIYGNANHQWTIILLAMIGKLSSAVNYTILYIITVELFPTTARNSVLGLCSVFENCGGVVSPYVADLGILVGGPLEQALPLMVFGAVTLIAGLTSLGLPETKDRPLPETFDDIIIVIARDKGDNKAESCIDEKNQYNTFSRWLWLCRSLSV